MWWVWIALAAIVTWAIPETGGSKRVKNDGNVDRRAKRGDRRKSSPGHHGDGRSRKRVKRKPKEESGDELAPEPEVHRDHVPDQSGDDLRGERDGPAPENSGVGEGDSK